MKKNRALASVMPTDQLHRLWLGLAGRVRPETVLALMVEHDRTLPAPLRKLLEHHARGSGRFWASMMPETFQAPRSLVRSVNALLGQLGTDTRLSEEAARDPEQIAQFVARAQEVIRKVPGERHKLNRAARAALGVELSRRVYRRMHRTVGRLERDLAELRQQDAIFQLGRFAKTSFAAQIPWEAFAQDVPTAEFVAYQTARLGLRSLFTNASQVRAFDEHAEALLARARASEHYDPFLVAQVFPRPAVLRDCTVEQRMELLARTLELLHRSAELLHETALRSNLNVQTMMVRKGNDSSTWNAVAGAWNRGRDFWLALMESLGQSASFEVFLPGKVLRLMAADVMRWHAATGGAVDPDTVVWAVLPKPWDVMRGTARCGRADVERACRAAGVQKGGWTRAKARMQVAAWTPTPELVHGVEVAQPELAFWLRKVGVFSGQELRIEQAEAAEQAMGPLSPWAVTFARDAHAATQNERAQAERPEEASEETFRSIGLAADEDVLTWE